MIVRLPVNPRKAIITHLHSLRFPPTLLAGLDRGADPAPLMFFSQVNPNGRANEERVGHS